MRIRDSEPGDVRGTVEALDDAYDLPNTQRPSPISYKFDSFLYFFSTFMTRRCSFRMPSLLDLLESSRQAHTSKMEVDILIGLRIMEHLGRDQPTSFSTCHPLEDETVQILNWISLCIVSNSSSSYCDVAVAISAQPGNVIIHISSGSGPPSEHDDQSISLFMGALRHAFSNNLGPPLIVRSFLGMLAHRAFPQIIRKIAAVREVGSGDPTHTYERFCSLVSAWLHYRREGEMSRGFVDLATESAGGGIQANNVMVQSFLNLLFHNIGDTQGMNPQEKYQYMVSVLTSCDLLVNSTFFDDLLNHNPFRLSLEISDRKRSFAASPMKSY